MHTSLFIAHKNFYYHKQNKKQCNDNNVYHKLQQYIQHPTVFGITMSQIIGKQLVVTISSENFPIFLYKFSVHFSQSAAFHRCNRQTTPC